MFASRTSAVTLMCVFATGCVTPPPSERIAPSAVSALPKASKVEENTNDLTEVLSCVGAQVAAYGTKPFFVGNDRIVNETGAKEGVPESARTMLQSAFATLVEKSNGKVIWSGMSTSLYSTVVDKLVTENQGIAKTRGTPQGQQSEVASLGAREFTWDTPQYFIVGSISQFEKDLQRATRDGNVKGKTAELANSEVASLSLLGTSMTLMKLTSNNMAMYKGIQSNNVFKMTTEEDSSSLFGGIASIAGIGLNVAIQKKEPVSGALMQLMQAGAIEITGKFYQDDFDYRGCLHKESRRQILGKLTGKNASSEEQSKESLLAHATNASLPKPSMILFAKGTYNHGDKVVVNAQGRDNGYLNCFYSNAVTRRSPVRIFPNRRTSDNLLSAGQKVSVLSDNDPEMLVQAEKGAKEKVSCIFSRVNVNPIIVPIVTSNNEFTVETLLEKIKIDGIPESAFDVKEFEIRVGE